MPEPRERTHVEADLVVESIGIEGVEVTRGSEAGVVHHEVDRRLGARDPYGDLLDAVVGGEVGGQHLDAGMGLGQRLQPVGATSDHDLRHALCSKLAHHGLADATGRAGDESGGETSRISHGPTVPASAPSGEIVAGIAPCTTSRTMSVTDPRQDRGDIPGNGSSAAGRVD